MLHYTPFNIADLFSLGLIGHDCCMTRRWSGIGDYRSRCKAFLVAHVQRTVVVDSGLRAAQSHQDDVPRDELYLCIIP